jgi:hypothetical protein
MDSFNHDSVWRDALNNKESKMYTGYENWTLSEITRGLEEMNTPLARELINRLNSNLEEDKDLEGRIEYLEEELWDQ